MISSTFTMNKVSDGTRSATPGNHGSSDFARMAGMTSRSENTFLSSGADPTPSLASSSSESSQQDGELQLRKSCDYCVRMKRGCDGGTPCELCTRRNKYCIRSVKKRSGPAKCAHMNGLKPSAYIVERWVPSVWNNLHLCTWSPKGARVVDGGDPFLTGTKYCKRRARNKKSPMMNRSEQTVDIVSPMSSTSCGARGGRSVSEDADNDREDRDGPTGAHVSTATPVAKTVVPKSTGERSINGASISRAHAPDLAGSAKVAVTGEKSVSPDAAPGVNQSHSRWQQHSVEPGVGEGSCIPISFSSEKSVDSTSRTPLSRGSAGENVMTQSAARVAVGRRGSLEQPTYETYCRRSSINALLETREMDMDRKDRKDKTGSFWGNRIHGDTPGNEGLRPAPVSVNMGMSSAGTPHAGAVFRTTGVPFMDTRAANFGVPSPGLATSSDPSLAPSLRELLLEKWPPVSELTITETSQ